MTLVSVPTATGVQMSSSAVSDSQTTTSGSFTDLSTGGPSVTLTTGSKALVIVSALMHNSSTGQFANMDFSVSGSSSRGATTETAARVGYGSAADTPRIKGASATVVSLTPGSNTFTAKYSVSGGTGTFSAREICVISL